MTTTPALSGDCAAAGTTATIKALRNVNVFSISVNFIPRTTYVWSTPRIVVARTGEACNWRPRSRAHTWRVRAHGPGRSTDVYIVDAVLPHGLTYPSAWADR